MRIVYEKAPKIETIANIIKDATTKSNSKKRHLNQDTETAENAESQTVLIILNSQKLQFDLKKYLTSFFVGKDEGMGSLKTNLNIIYNHIKSNIGEKTLLIHKRFALQVSQSSIMFTNFQCILTKNYNEMSLIAKRDPGLIQRQSTPLLGLLTE